jgi:vancomycin aglycone glucosyltransferase
MRVLFSTIGSRGDVQPLVALASYLKALGHEVRVCVPPDFREWIEGLGIKVTPIGPEVRRFAASRPMATQPHDPPTPQQRRQMAEATVATQFETVTRAAQDCDIIVAATALQVAARSVAEKMGIPYVFIAYSPVVLPSPHHAPPPLPPLQGQAPTTMNDNRELWARDAERFNDLFGAAVNAHRASLGLAPVSDLRTHMMTDRPWLAADPTLGPWPEAAEDGVFQTGAWILPDERPLSCELHSFLESAQAAGRGVKRTRNLGEVAAPGESVVRDFLQSGEPPIYFGFGSTRAPQDAGQVMLQAARAVGRRAIVSQGWFETSLIENEADCLSIGEVNVHALFSRVAAVVHHGGAGTTTAAALAGAPQVVIPNHYDQHYWAQRVQTLGIGTAHAPGSPTTDSLANALARTLRREVGARARSIAAVVRRDGTQIAAETLIARRHAS